MAAGVGEVLDPLETMEEEGKGYVGGEMWYMSRGDDEEEEVVTEEGSRMACFKLFDPLLKGYYYTVDLFSIMLINRRQAA